MLFADSGAVSGSICFVLLPALVVIGWVLKKREKEKAEAQRQLQQPYVRPLTPRWRKVATGIIAHLITGIVTGMLGGHRHHGHRHDQHGG